jgi:hypothetical protein
MKILILARIDIEIIFSLLSFFIALKIHISSATGNMLRETDLFEIEERGELQIKVSTFKIFSRVHFH